MHALRKIAFTSMSMIVLSAATAAAQPALERLERQLQAPAAQQPAREAGYLGLVTRNDTAGGFIRVVQVVPGSPAAVAGMRTDDVILGAGGRLTREMNDLATVLQGRAPGEQISFDVMRGQEPRTVAITLGRRQQTEDGPALIPPQAQAGDRPAAVAAGRPPGPPAPETIDPSRPATPRSEAARLDLLERRMAELERRLAELERLLTGRP